VRRFSQVFGLFCGLSAGLGLGEPTLAQTVTFAEDVAPLLHEHCVVCHRPGAVGPMSLVTYEDAPVTTSPASSPQRAIIGAEISAIRDQVLSRRMPHWKPVDARGVFRNERGLSAAQLGVLERWAAAGAPQGDPSAAPSPPPAPDGW